MRGLARHERDARLLSRAPADGLHLPGPEELRTILRASLLQPESPDPRSLDWQYARWKPGQSLCLGWELEFEGGARAWLAWKRYVRDPGRAAGAQARLDERTWAWVFPGDRALPGLPRALDLQRRARDLQGPGEAGPARLRWRHARAELLRYKPERRAVLRLDWGERSHALRVLTPRAAARCLAARRAFEFECAPRLLAAREEHGLVYEEWLELHEPALTRVEAAALLARLHAQRLLEGIPACPRLSPREELEPLFALEPALLRRSRALPLEEPAGERVWSHGDFHLGQLARSGRGPVLLDLDSLGRASRARDLAAWIGEACLLEPNTPSRDAILDAYTREGGQLPPESELRAALAAELVRRAAAGVRRLESGALERAERLLGQAEEVVRAAQRPAPAAIARTFEALEQRLGGPVRDAVQRCDLDERGAATLMLALPGGPRWFRAAEAGLEELALDQDARLPGSAAARELLGRGAAELVSWRPGRRFVLALPASVRKGLRASRHAKALALQEHFAQASRKASFRVAAVLARDEAQATFDLERLPGRALDFGSDAARAGELAQALQELQAFDLGALAPHQRSDELRLLDGLADRHARAAGSLPVGWERLFEALELERAGGQRRVCAHRDLFEAQILVEPGGLSLLDFDLACQAEPELDPGNLLAHLDLARLSGRVQARPAAAFESAFLGACAQRSLVEERALRFYRGTSLLRLALVHGLRARGHELAPALLARAQELLDA